MNPATPAIVKQGVNCFLQHSLFISDDQFWCLEFDQLFQTVIAIDNTTIEIIQIRSSKSATVQSDQWPQIRRDNWNNIENHPFRPVA